MVEEKRFFFRSSHDSELVEVGTPALTELVMPILDQMSADVVYVVTIQGPKVKRTTTGRYVSHDLTDLILLDKRGKFQRVTIDRIIRINYYIESPF